MPSKRSHGEGTLRHRSDGRWELRMMDGYQKDGSPRFKTFYGKTQKEVKLKLKEYQDALISGVQLDTILYFEDWADTWFEGHKDNIAPTTQESYKYCLKMLKEGFYHRPLTVIRPIDIENFLKGVNFRVELGYRKPVDDRRLCYPACHNHCYLHLSYPAEKEGKKLLWL